MCSYASLLERALVGDCELVLGEHAIDCFELLLLIELEAEI